MDADDMIMISVDDHLVEPPDLFENHLPASYAGRDEAPRVERRRDGSDVWMFNGHEDPERRPQRRRRPTQGGVRHRADRLRRDAPRLLEHRRPHQGHERRRRAGFDVLPVVPRVLRADVRHGRRQGLRPRRAAGLQRLARRRVVRPPTPAASSPWASCRCGTPRWRPTRSAAWRAKGVHSITFTENPATLGYDSFHNDSWDPLWAACADDGRGACRSTSARRASWPSPHPTPPST